MNPSSDLTVFFTMEGFRGLFTGEPDGWVRGGAQIQMSYLARAFADSPGVSVVLIFDQPTEIAEHPHLRATHLEAPIRRGLPYISRHINRRRKAAPFLQGVSRGVLLQSQAESLEIAEVARLCGVKTVFRVNGDSLVDGSVLHGHGALESIHQRILAADLVITQTERQQRLAHESLGIESTVAGSGLPLEGVSIGPADAREHVLWVGRGHPIKRPWVFVELAKLLPAHKFLMVLTSGYAPLKNEIMTEARLVSNLEIVEQATHDEVLDLQRGAHVLVNTSISEGISNTFLEAAAVGTPVLSYLVDPDDILSGQKVGLCAFNDFRQLEELLRSLLLNADLREAVGRSAREYAEKNWDIRVVAETYLEAFRGLFE